MQTALNLDSLFTCSKGWTMGGSPGTWTCLEGMAESLEDAVGIGTWSAGNTPPNAIASPAGMDPSREAWLISGVLRIPREERVFLTLRHAYSFDASEGGALVEIREGPRSEEIVPVGGYPGKIQAPGTSLDGRRGFVGSARSRPWHVDVFDASAWRGKSVQVVFRTALSAQAGVLWKLDQMALAGGKPCDEATPDAILAQESEAVVASLGSAHTSAYEQELAQMPEQMRRKLVDQYAWYGVDPLALTVVPWIRGVAGAVRGRDWAFDPAPSLPPGEVVSRAAAFLADAGRKLFGLSEKPLAGLWLANRTVLLPAGEVRYEQIVAGYPVEDAHVQVSLDERGRVQGVASSYVPEMRLSLAARVAQDVAETIAWKHLRDSLPGNPPQSDPRALDSVLVAVNTVRFGGDPSDHLGWRVLVQDGRGDMHDVWVDALDGTVLGAIERTRLMDESNKIFQVAGHVGGYAYLANPPGCAAIWTGAGAEPDGDPDGTCTADPLGLCTTIDAERTKRAMEVLESLIDERGGEASPGTGFADWAPVGDLRVGLGAEGLLSIGQNKDSLPCDGVPVAMTIILAANGSATVDLIGHELGHSMTDSGAMIRYVTGATKETEAIEEHLGDTIGAFVKQRSFAPRYVFGEPGSRGDVFTLADETDAMETIGDTAFIGKPCTWVSDPRPWRSMRDPSQLNGGWCEGSTHMLEHFYNSYDAFGLSLSSCLGDSREAEHHVAGHTSLGIGDKFVYLVANEDVVFYGYRGFRISRLGFDTAERVAFHGFTHMGSIRDWSSYLASWHAGARDVDTDDGSPGGLGPHESTTRTAAASVGIWNEPVNVAAGLLEPWRGSLAPQHRPAHAAVLIDRDGADWQRNFIFYVQRPMIGDATYIEYYWWDVPPSGRATTPPSFQGPCTLSPLAANTADGLAAAPVRDGVLVAWRDSSAAPTAGSIVGAVLSEESILAAGSGCPDGWTRSDPAAQRLAEGGPALVTWSPGGYLEYRPFTGTSAMPRPLPDLWPPATMPPLDPDGDKKCLALDQRDPYGGQATPIDPGACAAEFSTVRALLNTSGARTTPSLLEAAAPGTELDGLSTESSHPQLRRMASRDPQVSSLLMGLPGEHGERWKDVLQNPSGTRMRWRDATLQFGLDFQPDGKTAAYREMVIRYDEPRVFLAYRQSGNLYVVAWDDTTPSTDLTALATDVEPTDPSLATVGVPSIPDWWVPRYMLYALYVDDVEADGVTQADHPFYRVARGYDRLAGLTADDFAAPQDISTILRQVERYYAAPPGTSYPARTTGRMIDYQYARTIRPIDAVGAKGLLHIFVVGRNLQNSNGFHRASCTDVDRYVWTESAGESVNRYGSNDVLRWGALRPRSVLDGTLEPEGQRMVVVERTEQETISAGGYASTERIESQLTAGVSWFDPWYQVTSLVFPRTTRRGLEIRRIPTR